MLFTILKLFGIDVHAKIAAAKVNLEQQVTNATQHVAAIGQTVAVLGALALVSVMTGLMTTAVCLIALYRWLAEHQGPYVALAAVGGILAFITILVLAVAVSKAKTLSSRSSPGPMFANANGANAYPNPLQQLTPSTVSGIGAPPSVGPDPPLPESASDLIEPLALFFSKFVSYPSFGNPVLDEMVRHLKTSAKGTADEALSRTSSLIRNGNRTAIVTVLGTAAFLGWLLARQTPPHHG
jgi:hypothetical protein